MSSDSIPSDLLDRFKTILKNNHLKFTVQREIVLRARCEGDGHFTPELLRNRIYKRFGHKIGIATIYRALTLLEQEQIVTSVSFGVSGKRYEYGLKAHHDHMICERCGAMIEFIDPEIERRQEMIAKRHSFKILNHTMQINGICEECQQKDKR
jgi:Fur family ferric uptake transcriptional regulator